MHEPSRSTPATDSATGHAASRAAASGPRQHDGALLDLLAGNLDGVRAQLSAAAERFGRTAPTLVAVTKSVPSPVALALFDLGCGNLAENRADAFLAKADAFEAAGATPTWHFVGHLQRNKARRVIERAHVLHSVDSLRLADAVRRLTDELERTVDVFVQVNLTGEDEKHGLTPDEAREAVERLAEAEHVRVLGLMAMGPLRSVDGRSTGDVFGRAAELAKELASAMPDAFVDGTCRLSMGMSGDVDDAIEHGTDMVRVGSSLFAGLDGAAPAARERSA